MFIRFTPRTLARAPFRVAVSVATSIALLGAGGFMALPRSPDAAPSIAQTAIVPTPITATGVSTAVPVAAAASTGPSLANAKPADVTCLAKAVYYEARGESAEGQAAVAQVVLNRTHRRSYPSNVCGVVFQGAHRGDCQFSFVCNGAMDRPLEPTAWTRARRVASNALNGHVMSAVGHALSFHVAALGAEGGQIARIGSHVFFMPGRARGGAVSHPIHTLRLAEQDTEAPSPATASVSHDAVATVLVAVASGGEAGSSAQMR